MTYQAPEMTVILLQHEDVISTSLTVDNDVAIPGLDYEEL